MHGHHDVEEFVDILRDEAIRDEFVDRLSQFGRTFEIALSSFDWVRRTEDPGESRFTGVSVAARRC